MRNFYKELMKLNYKYNTLKNEVVLFDVDDSESVNDEDVIDSGKARELVQFFHDWFNSITLRPSESAQVYGSIEMFDELVRNKTTMLEIEKELKQSNEEKLVFEHYNQIQYSEPEIVKTFIKNEIVSEFLVNLKARLHTKTKVISEDETLYYGDCWFGYWFENLFEMLYEEKDSLITDEVKDEEHEHKLNAHELNELGEEAKRIKFMVTDKDSKLYKSQLHQITYETYILNKDNNPLTYNDLIEFIVELDYQIATLSQTNKCLTSLTSEEIIKTFLYCFRSSMYYIYDLCYETCEHQSVVNNYQFNCGSWDPNDMNHNSYADLYNCNFIIDFKTFGDKHDTQMKVNSAFQQMNTYNRLINENKNLPKVSYLILINPIYNKVIIRKL